MKSACSCDYRLQVGPVNIEINCDSPEYAASMASYFGQPSSPFDPDISLELRIVSHTDLPELPDSLITTKVVDDTGFAIDGDLITGYFEPQTSRGRLNVKNILSKGHFTRVFEQILYQATQSALKTKGIKAVMVHSSAVIARGAGFLFVGASGKGKSTVAGLSPDYQVLNDEMNLVQFEEGTPILHGTPFNGFFQEKEPGQAPLAAVILLEHGPGHRLENVGPAEAVSMISAQVCPPIGLEDPYRPDVRFQMLDLAQDLADSVPVKKMFFTPDTGFWDLVLSRFLKEPQ